MKFDVGDNGIGTRLWQNETAVIHRELDRTSSQQPVKNSFVCHRTRRFLLCTLIRL